MKSLETYIYTIIFGATAAGSAFSALDNFDKYDSVRNKAIDSLLSSGKGLTRQTVLLAREDAWKIAHQDYFSGLLNAIGAGASGGLALYFASRKEDK